MTRGDERLGVRRQLPASFTSFDDWWEPMTFGIGPARKHVAELDEHGKERLRAAAEGLMPPASFEVSAEAGV